MPEQRDALNAARPTLIERLQQITEALAAADTQQAVFDIVLTPALEAVGAVAGVVLLVGEEAQALHLAATQGHEPDLKASRQAGHLDHELPAGDALQRQEALFFESYDALTRSYPALEPRTGTRAPSASAVLPMVLDDQPLGVVVLDFREPHDFQPDEQRFLRALAAQCSIALGRVTLARDLERQVEDALRDSDLLAALGDALQQARTPEEVATLALSKLGPALQALSMLVVQINGEQIRLPTLWGDMPQQIFEHMTRPGLAIHDTPLLRRVAEAEKAAYLEDYRREPGTVASFPALAVGVEPICLPDGTLEGFLVIWRPVQLGGWRASEQRVLHRAANTLGLALERAGQAETLREKNTELQARTQALEGFALLSRDFSLEYDPVRLVGRAQELILSLLPDGVSTYYEWQGDRWELVSHRGIFPDPTLLQVLQRGVPRGGIPNIERPFNTHLPYYQDRLDTQPLTVAQEEFVVVKATAALPVFVADQVQGVMVFGLHQAHTWAAPERAVLETVVRSLGLALERSLASRELAKQRDALEARSKELAAANEELKASRTPSRMTSGRPCGTSPGFSSWPGRPSVGTSMPRRPGIWMWSIRRARS